jgi:hypothetical protein
MVEKNQNQGTYSSGSVLPIPLFERTRRKKKRIFPSPSAEAKLHGLIPSPARLFIVPLP